MTTRTDAKQITAKALIADALVFCVLDWTIGETKTALALADFMYRKRNGEAKRTARVSQATIAAKRSSGDARCSERRVRQHLGTLCRRRDEHHDPRRHVFIRGYCWFTEEGRPRGHKAAVYTLAPEFEAMVLAARSRIETDGLQPVRSGNKADGAQPVRSVETDDLQPVRSGSNRTTESDRTGRLEPIEPDPREGAETGSSKTALKPVTKYVRTRDDEPDDLQPLRSLDAQGGQFQPSAGDGDGHHDGEATRAEFLAVCREIATRRRASLTSIVVECSTIPPGNGFPRKAGFFDPRDRRVPLAWVEASLARAHALLDEQRRPVPL